MVDPGDFKDAKQSTDELLSNLRDMVFEGRDLTDEVKKLTKEIYGASEAAAQINKTFRDLSRLERGAADGMLDILDGSRKLVDVQKDITKNTRLQNQLQGELGILQGGYLARQKDLASFRKIGLNNLTEEQKQRLSQIKGELELAKIIRQKIQGSKDLEKSLKEQNDLLEKGETALKKTLTGTADILDKVGLKGLAKPLKAAGEAARVAAINGKDFAGQLTAATNAAKKLIAEMIILGMVTAGLQFDKQVANFSRNMGITRSEASDLRREMTEIANDSGRFSINSADTLKALENLQTQFGTVGNVLRNDIVQEMAVLGKLTNMSAESQGNFARFANISGKNARTITLETRRAVVNAEQERGLRVDINKTLDEAGKINGQIAAKLQGNVTAIASAITVAKQFGMTLQQVAKTGAQLLDFQTNIGNELEAELLTGRQINLERARLFALQGDYEKLTREINQQIGDFGDFTGMNILQQNALAKSIGMTADELSDVLLKNENIEELAAEARANGDIDLAKQLERRSAQEKFTDAVAKMKQLFVDIVGGPVGTFLDMVGSIFGFISRISEIIPVDKFLNLAITAGIILKTFGLLRSVLVAQNLLMGKIVGKAALKLGYTTADKAAEMAKTGILTKNNILSLIGLNRQRSKTGLAFGEMAAKMGSKTFGIGALLGAALAGAVIAAIIGSMAQAEEGGLIKGKNHSSGGTMIEAEQGEFIMSRSAVNRLGVNNVAALNAGGSIGGTAAVDMSQTNELLATMISNQQTQINQPKFDSIFSLGNQNSGTVARRNVTQGNVGDQDQLT